MWSEGVIMGERGVMLSWWCWAVEEVWMAQADKGSGPARWDSGSVVGGPKRCESDDERRMHGQVYV